MKKYVIDNPTLIAEWNFDKNNALGLDPSTITCGVDTKAWWTCPQCGFEYYSIIGNRSRRGVGCPKCGREKRGQSRVRTLVNKNGSFMLLHPELMVEWDLVYNNIDPNAITERSNVKVNWICQKCKYRWIATPNDRIRGRGCPICSKDLIGVNSRKTKLGKSGSLLESNPALAAEWDNEKNEFASDNISPKSHYNAFWICHRCGNKWQAPVYARCIGAGCPKCSKVKKFSFPEKLLLFFVRKAFPDAISSYKPAFLKPKEIDVFIPSRMIGIEYDGERYHKNTEKDRKKTTLCLDRGISLIRIREPKCPDIDFSTTYKMKSLKDFKGAANFIFQTLNVPIEVTDEAIADASIIVSAEVLNLKKENSLAARYPKIAEEWDSVLNGDLTPEYVPCGSNLKVNWICKKGHRFKMVVAKRTSRGTGCPICRKEKESL